MRRTFVKVGLWKAENGEFRAYTSHKKLGMTELLPSTEKAVWAEEMSSRDAFVELTTSFGEICSEVEIVTREQDELAVDAEDESEGSDSD